MSESDSTSPRVTRAGRAVEAAVTVGAPSGRWGIGHSYTTMVATGALIQFWSLVNLPDCEQIVLSQAHSPARALLLEQANGNPGHEDNDLSRSWFDAVDQRRLRWR